MLLENAIDDFEQIEDESSHVLHFWSPCKTEVTKDYDFIPNGLLFHILSSGLLYFAYAILSIFNRLVFGFKIEGKENLKSVKGRKSNCFQPCSSIRLHHGSVLLISLVLCITQLLNPILEFLW